jgi:hypothetical protein
LSRHSYPYEGGDKFKPICSITKRPLMTPVRFKKGPIQELRELRTVIGSPNQNAYIDRQLMHWMAMARAALRALDLEPEEILRYRAELHFNRTLLRLSFYRPGERSQVWLDLPLNSWAEEEASLGRSFREELGVALSSALSFQPLAQQDETLARFKGLSLQDRARQLV